MELAFTAASPFPVTGSKGSLLLSPRVCRNALASRPLHRRARASAPAMVTASKPAQSEQSASEIPAAPAFFTSTSFASLGLSIEIVNALSAADLHQPTSIQSRGIPAILSGADTILGAATGSGKTLAYLLPVIQMLKSAESMRNPGDPPLRIARRPRAVILLPTRELASQVLSVAKALSHAVKFRAVGVIGGGAGSMRKAKDGVGSAPVDVLVGTTGRISQLASDRSIDLRFASHIVVDEVDTMFDAGFGPELRTILAAARKGRGENPDVPRLQCVAAGATHPRAAEEAYATAFPGAVRLDADLHRPPPGLVQRFVDVNARTKLPEMIALLGEAGRDGMLRGGRVIVFCNTMDSCRFLDCTLREAGYTTSCIHGDVPSSRREEEYAAFRGGKTQLMVCSDMAARGLDNLKVDHVILFDFPNSAVDYIHRAGRTARAGAKGKVTSLIMKKDQRLAAAIQKAERGRGDALEGARRAREEELRRKSEEEARAKLVARQQMKEGVYGEERGDAVPFTSSRRFGAPSRGKGRGRGGGGRGGGRGSGRGSFVRRGRSARSG